MLLMQVVEREDLVEELDLLLEAQLLEQGLLDKVIEVVKYTVVKEMDIQLVAVEDNLNKEKICHKQQTVFCMMDQMGVTELTGNR